MHAWPKKVSTMETDELAGLWTRLEGASRLWWLVVLTTIAGCVAGFGYGYRAHPEVTAQASVVFRPASTAERFIDSLSSTAMATEKELASDPEVYARVVEITGTDNATISDKLTADVPLDSNVLILTATAADEDSAVELGNAYADAFLDFRSSLNSSDTEAVAERTGPARVPNPGHNVGLTKSSVFGGLLGLVIGLAAALVLASRDNRLRGRRSLREVMPDSPIWALVPTAGSPVELGLAAATLVAHLPTGQDRAAIAVVAGATAGDLTEGVVRGVAEALTDRGLRVLTVHIGRHREETTPATRLVLANLPEERPGRWWSLDLEALPLGAGSARLTEAARQLAGRVDLVLVAGTDASRSRASREAIAEADVVVLVARHAVTRTPEIAAARESIELLDKRVHGLIVLNLRNRARTYDHSAR